MDSGFLWVSSIVISLNDKEEIGLDSLSQILD